MRDTAPRQVRQAVNMPFGGANAVNAEQTWRRFVLQTCTFARESFIDQSRFFCPALLSVHSVSHLQQ